MNSYILLLIATIPTILLLIYIYNKDTNKEPKNLLSKVFILGMLSIIPIIIIEIILSIFFDTENTNNLISLFINVFIGTALVEEGFKWLIVKYNIYNNKEYDEYYDGIVYGVFASLGFAIIENINYVFAKGIGIGLARAITSIPSHAVDGVFIGYYLSKSKIDSKNKDKYILLSILIPTLLHTIYDFLIIANNILFIIVWMIFHITIVIIAIILINKISKNNIKLNIRYCSKCGKEVKGNYCSSCGNKIK